MIFTREAFCRFLVILLGDLERGLDRLGAATYEQDVGESARACSAIGFASQMVGQKLPDRADVVERNGLIIDGPGDLCVRVAQRVGPGWEPIMSS